MKRIATVIIATLCISLSAMSQDVTIHAVNQPAAAVFRSIMQQTGKNFVYSSELLSGMKVTVSARKRPLKKVLDDIFTGTDIEYKIKGKNVILKRKPRKTDKQNVTRNINPLPSVTQPTINPKELDEVIVISRLEPPAVETSDLGARKVTADEVINTPALFGEPDVIKALHTEPGVSEGTEGTAGMYVHGGNADENLYMLDNVPLYQVNHFAGLFSAFNTDIIRYIDFFKSSMPAKYDGRLSSFMDVRLQNGKTEGHHGTARLGLTSGTFNISGPINDNTTYLIGLRRSWYDLLTVPAMALINSGHEEKVRFHYYFMDLNGKLTHRFSSKATGFISVYFGDDMLKTGSKDNDFDGDFSGFAGNDKYNFHWGNLIAQTGLNYRISADVKAEFTAAYTRYFSSLSHHEIYKENDGNGIITTEDRMKTKNNINDWIFRADFDWLPGDNSHVRFGADYIRHSFLPARTSRVSVTESTSIESRDSTWTYGGNEFNAYIEDDWRINDRFRINAGFHASLFNIERKMKYGLAPRMSFSYRPADNIAVKAAYSRTTQYVHQLTQSYLSLPTDQWIPVTGNLKPQTADKIAIGGYWQAANGTWAVSVEGYYKWMHNLLDYCEDYYLKPPLEMWNARLTTGRGTANGIDIKVEKRIGRLTGQASYSLAWSDRTFANKNGGQTYPARFDNRHTINLLLNWEINDRVQLNARWTGHSGNRFTLMPQMWETPSFNNGFGYVVDEVPLRTPLNNYQLPFYHRLDLSCTIKNSRGYWTFGLYNAYNHMNTIAITRGYNDETGVSADGSYYSSRPVFQKVKLLPIIPSISYTWQF